ncbi:FIST N-terminal domain-containing protein [Labilibaculum euxinus]|uniref:histidine kinase n=1 Tax=Labilibaculum euxinus TaxID=2686357 RepID=A0A7M4D8P5_9BACT|nr:FIST N-terminal domain-containing protein [Labilibaculum euxinus]MUP39024.1 GHKL domain-containing protein [Labilibaculum euxinus]MVB08229.1 GHKL domain-containing protein [Labilibaculum euxinus]
MHQHNFKISDINDLKKILQSDEISHSTTYQSLLVQVFSAHNKSDWYLTIGETIKEVYPDAVIIGATSVGEITEGRIFTNSTAVLFSFFESAKLNLFSYSCQLGEEEKVGNALLKNTKLLDDKIKGMLLLSTPITNDSGKIFNTLATSSLDFPIFGGGAGDYANERETLVFDGEKCYKEGIVAVCFSGGNLQIELSSCLGWQPLSKEMTITDVGDVAVKTIDNMPAFSVYEKYLGIKADNNFFQNSLEFPFIITRNNHEIARTPFFVNEDDQSIQMVADVKAGEKFRIGYGNPQTIKEESAVLQHQMCNFKPEAIFIYTCICRRFLMQDEVDFETLPFNAIAPTAGFYTFGEFFSNNSFHALLNSSMVTVGFREGEPITKAESSKDTLKKNTLIDPYTNQHNRILSRLIFFINVLIEQMEEKSLKLKVLNEQKNEIIGIVAHDLRSPLGVIQGFSELLEDEMKNEEHKDFASLIHTESSNLLYLLNDLLDISKIESGKLDLKRKEIDYIALIHRNIKTNSFFAQKKNISITVESAIEHQLLSVDEGQIIQVLNNIIGNAIKYSYPDSEIKIKVFKENDQIITQIIDQGQGIPKEELENVFTMFQKTSTKPTGGESSHGLGLAIVKKIVEGHKGQINVESNQGKGSTFYFSLPID